MLSIRRAQRFPEPGDLVDARLWRRRGARLGCLCLRLGSGCGLPREPIGCENSPNQKSSKKNSGGQILCLLHRYLRLTTVDENEVATTEWNIAYFCVINSPESGL